MERQTQFVQALLEKVKSTEDGGNSMLRQFWQVGQPYITTDLSLDMLEKVASYDMNPEILKVPGRFGQEKNTTNFMWMMPVCRR